MKKVLFLLLVFSLLSLRAQSFNPVLAACFGGPALCAGAFLATGGIVILSTPDGRDIAINFKDSVYYSSQERIEVAKNAIADLWNQQSNQTISASDLNILFDEIEIPEEVEAKQREVAEAYQRHNDACTAQDGQLTGDAGDLLMPPNLLVGPCHAAVAALGAKLSELMLLLVSSGLYEKGVVVHPTQIGKLVHISQLENLEVNSVARYFKFHLGLKSNTDEESENTLFGEAMKLIREFFNKRYNY